MNGLVLVDNRAVTEWNLIFEAQMLTCFRLTKLKLGLVVNFGEQYVKNGIHRVVNGPYLKSLRVRTFASLR